MTFADYWRFEEWAREFERYEAGGDLPALELVRFPHDHLGRFLSALDGVNTPDAQMADNDYALGRLVERVSRSPFWKDTVVVALEDDAQNGADHVDRASELPAPGRRARPPARQGLDRVFDAERPPDDRAPSGDRAARTSGRVRTTDGRYLTTEADETQFVATVPAVLRTTRLPLPGAKSGEMAVAPRGTAASWAFLTHGFNSVYADAAPAGALNHILFCELVDSAGCTSEPPPAQACVARPGTDEDDE